MEPPRGPGRPRKPRDQRRGEMIPVRCSRAEKAEIQRRAGDLGISMAAYLREGALGRRTHRHADRRLRNELRQLALSLRVLAEAGRDEAAPTGTPTQEHPSLDALVERVVAVLNRLTRATASDAGSASGHAGEGVSEAQAGARWACAADPVEVAR